MKFICAQPAIDYYTWQVEVMINNFIRNGVDPKDIHIVCAYYGNIPEKWTKLKEHYTEVGFFFYLDTRLKPAYIPSVRPHILYQHWLKNPELENEIVFYHDCDIILSKPIDLENLLSDDVCYVSDTISYIGANYIKGKGEHYLDLMSSLVNVNKEFITSQEKNSGGAQYILKSVPTEFWKKVYYDAENLYRLVNQQIAKDKLSNPSMHDIQIWCADMWAVLWNLWFFGKEVRVTPKLQFSWATSRIEDYEKCPIYHNAGVTGDGHGLFYKGGYISKLPYDIKIESFTPTQCAYRYAEEIIKTKEVSCLV